MAASLMGRAKHTLAAAARWSFLHEWLTELLKHLYYHEREELDGGTLHSGLRSLCVYMTWPIENSDGYVRQVTNLREAMELIRFALRLDTAAWMLLAQPGTRMNEHFNPDDYAENELTPQVILKAFPYAKENTPGDNVQSIEVIEQLLVKTNAAQTSDPYWRARKELMSR